MTNNNGKSGQKAPTSRLESRSDETWQLIQQQADAAVEGASQAGMNHVNGAIARHAQALAENTNKVAETLELLMDPRTLVALSEIKAVKNLDDRLGKTEPRARVMRFQHVEIELPALPSFSQFYSSLPLGHQSVLPGSQEPNTQTVEAELPKVN